jgi:hypothetical protein
MLLHASENLKKNREIVLAAVKQNFFAFEFLEELNDHFEIVLEAVKQNGLVLKHAGEKMRDNREIVLEALNQNPLAFQYIGENIQKDEEIISILLKTNTLLKRTCLNCKQNISVYIHKNDKITCLGGVFIMDNFYRKEIEIEDVNEWLCKICFDEDDDIYKCECGYGIKQNCLAERCCGYAEKCISCGERELRDMFCGDCI